MRDLHFINPLPLIKYFFGDAKIVPVGVPPVKKSLEIGRAVADISTRLGLHIRHPRIFSWTVRELGKSININRYSKFFT